MHQETGILIACSEARIVFDHRRASSFLLSSSPPFPLAFRLGPDDAADDITP